MNQQACLASNGSIFSACNRTNVFHHEHNISMFTFLSDLFRRKASSPSTMASTVPLDLAPEATWTQRVLHACSTGNFKALEVVMDERDDDVDPESDELISEMMSAAVKQNRTEMLRHLIEQHPHFPTGHRSSLGFVQRDAFMEKGLLPVYKILLEKWPKVQEMDCGELGDHLGLAACNLDVPFVEWLLQNGADATKARIMGFRPVGHHPTPLITYTGWS